MGALEGFAFADWDAPAVFIFFAVLVLTDRLVWHKRLDKAEIERNYWRDIALKALGVAEGVTTAAEVLTTDAELAKEREKS